MNTTDRFIQGIFPLLSFTLNSDLEHSVRRCFLDYLGVTVAGSKILGKRGEYLIASMGDGKDCSIIGFPQKGTMHTASFINGFSSHVAELDDGVISGIIHPGAPIFTALLAVAEKEGCSFERFCIGAIVGYEVGVRLANAIQPSHKKLGYHASGTCGLIASAMGVAAMLNYSLEELKDTLSAAVVSSHGTLKVLEDSSELKPFNIASAASDGIVAAMVAKSGFQGPDSPLEGYAGFFAQNSEEVAYEKLFRKEGQPFCIDDVYMKPYAACRYCHPSIENALSLRPKLNMEISEIDTIEVRTYSLAVNNHDMTEVSNVSSAKMSIPFSIAVVLLHGSAGVDVYSDAAIGNEAIKELMKKIRVVADDEFSKEFPIKSIASMRISMKNGQILNTQTDCPKGESINPLSDKEVKDKFTSLLEYSGKQRETAVDLADNILYENKINLKQILSLLN